MVGSRRCIMSFKGVLWLTPTHEARGRASCRLRSNRKLSLKFCMSKAACLLTARIQRKRHWSFCFMPKLSE